MTTEPGDDTRTPWPFIAAAGVVVLVLVGIVLAAVISPAERNVTENDRVAAAVEDFVGYGKTGTDQQKQGTVCPGFVAARSPLAASGTDVELKGVQNTRIDSDRATAEVTFTPKDKAQTRTTWNLKRIDGRWRVCN